jgi:small conductance mechanosensitive channel
LVRMANAFVTLKNLELLLAQAGPEITSFQDIAAKLTISLYKATAGLVNGLLIFLAFILVAVIGQRVIRYATPRVKADPTFVLLISRVFYYGVLIFGVVTALSTAGMDVSALVAGLGLTGFALGFALKDVLSNLLSGLMLLAYRPFQIGDHISMASYEGTIETIRMRDTVVRGYDGRLILIPNTKLITEVVINQSAAALIRGSILINIRDAADENSVREIFQKVVLQAPSVALRVNPTLTVKDSDSHSVQLQAHYWYDPRDHEVARFRYELVDKLRSSVSRSGIRAEIKDQSRLVTQSEKPMGEQAEEGTTPEEQL